MEIRRWGSNSVSRLSAPGEYEGTVAMCDAAGMVVSFVNLFVEPQGMPAGWENDVAPELPLNHVWETDL